MNPKKDIQKIIPPEPGNPFKVPEGYFEDVQKRVMERIRAEEEQEHNEKKWKEQKGNEQELKEQNRLRIPGRPIESSQAEAGGPQEDRTPGQQPSRKRKIYLQPYLSLAAAISGVALVVYIVLQSVTGNRAGENDYDIATLDRAGLIQDESALAEAYAEEDEASTYSDWDEEAIVYLASNEVDLLNLLDSN